MQGELEGGIGVLDFGGQYAHLICRRVRALGVYAALLPHDVSARQLEEEGVAGVILSGGPASVYSEGAPRAALDAVKPLAVSKMRDYGIDAEITLSNVPVVKGARAISEFWPGTLLGLGLGLGSLAIGKGVMRIFSRR